MRTTTQLLHCRGSDISVRLLADIRDVWPAGQDRIFSQDLVDLLTKMEDRPWIEWRHGNGLTPASMSRLLRRYDIGPKKLRIGGVTKQGYDLESFTDAFDRYLPPHPTHKSEHLEQSNGDAGNRGSADQNTGGDVPVYEPSENPGQDYDVPVVPVQTLGTGGLSAESGLFEGLDNVSS